MSMRIDQTPGYKGQPYQPAVLADGAMYAGVIQLQACHDKTAG